MSRPNPAKRRRAHARIPRNQCGILDRGEVCYIHDRLSILQGIRRLYGHPGRLRIHGGYVQIKR